LGFACLEGRPPEVSGDSNWAEWSFQKGNGRRLEQKHKNGEGKDRKQKRELNSGSWSHLRALSKGLHLKIPTDMVVVPRINRLLPGPY